MPNNDETADWARYDPVAGRLTLTVHVQPNARQSAIAGRHGDALIAFIAQTLGLPGAAVTIRHGATSRRKIVAIAPVDAGAALRLLAGAR